jgi:CheY-like chemotaxis protein
MHGGRAEANSDGEGMGATFTLRFPVPSAHVPNAGAALADARIPGRMRPLDAVKVLVVEDDADARDLVAHLLADAGALVTPSADAEQALLTMHASVPFDIIVSDIGMPGMDGYEFIARMRQQEQELSRPRVPAIALTALARTEDRQNALLAGFHAHVVKPVNPSELTIVIVSALGRAAGLPRGVA